MTAWPDRAVYLVTDRRRLSPSARTEADALLALDRFLDEAVEAGVDAIQIRERDLGAALVGTFVARLVDRVHGTAVRVLVNDRLDVALAAGAHGVHLPTRGLPVARAREVGHDAIIGRSAHQDESPSGWAGADYLLFGAIFPSASKPPAWRPAGLAGLRRAVETTRVPVVAIGGVDVSGAEACAEAGAAGMAAIGLFLPPGAAPCALGVSQAVPAVRAALARGQDRRVASV